MAKSKQIFFNYHINDARWKGVFEKHFGQHHNKFDFQYIELRGTAKQLFSEKDFTAFNVVFFVISKDYLSMPMVENGNLEESIISLERSGTKVVLVHAEHCEWQKYPWIVKRGLKQGNANALADYWDDPESLDRQVSQLIRDVMSERDGAEILPKLREFTGQEKNELWHQIKHRTLQKKFQKIQSMMPDLLEEMRTDFTSKDGPLVREFVVLPAKGVPFNPGPKKRFAYFENEHTTLRNKIDILESKGFVTDVTPGNTPIYRITEEFFELLTSLKPVIVEPIDWRTDFRRFIEDENGWLLRDYGGNLYTALPSASILTANGKDLVAAVQFEDDSQTENLLNAKKKLDELDDCPLGKFLVTPPDPVHDFDGTFLIRYYWGRGFQPIQQKEFPSHKDFDPDMARLQLSFQKFLREEKHYPLGSYGFRVKDKLILNGPTKNEVALVGFTLTRNQREFGDILIELNRGMFSDRDVYLVYPSISNPSDDFQILKVTENGTVSILKEDFLPYEESENRIRQEEDQGNPDDYYRRIPTHKRVENGCWLVDVPYLPHLHIEQYGKISGLSHLLEDEKNIAISGKAGIGKSTLALELVHSKNIQMKYPDGIVWIPFKDKPSAIEIQHKIAEIFQSGTVEPASITSGRDLLKRLLSDKKFLIVFDDLEQLDDIKPFIGLGKDVRIVATTRLEDVESVEGINAQPYRPVPFVEPTDSEVGGKLHIKRKASLEETCLNAEEYADVLKDVIIGAKNEKEGFCFALYGNWGRGKTFLMEKVKDKLGNTNHETIFFSAWKYPTSPEVWIHLYETFASKVFSSHSLAGWLRVLKAGVFKSSLWPMILVIVSLAIAILPKVSLAIAALSKTNLLIQILTTVSIPSAIFWFLFCLRVKSAAFQMSHIYLKPPKHRHKLGLQKIIGDDFIALLKAYIPKDKINLEVGRANVFIYYASFAFLFIALGIKVFGEWPIAFFFAYLLTALVYLVSEVVIESAHGPDKVLLVIDDLDRCPHPKLVEIVESIMLLLEDEEVSKRVQVVMLVEEEVLKQSLAEKYKTLIKRGCPDNEQTEGEEKRKERIVKENIEKLFIGHLRLNPLTAKEVHEIVSKITKRDLKDEAPKEQAGVNKKKSGWTSKTWDVSDEDKPGIIVNIPGETKQNNFIITDMAFTSEEDKILPESIKQLRNIESEDNLGPRSIRCFLFKYQLARLICKRLSIPCSPQMLADVLVETISLNGERATQSLYTSERDVLKVIAKQVC